MKSGWPIVLLFIVLVALAGLALRWNILGGTSESKFVMPTRWTAPALTTSTSQPLEATGWWEQLPTKKPVGKQPTSKGFLSVTATAAPTKTLKP